MPQDCDKVVDIVRRLASYVDANPLACDAAPGIARWWLQAEFEDVADVQHALDWMTAHGLMEELVAVDGRLRYRRVGTAAEFAAALASLH